MTSVARQTPLASVNPIGRAATSPEESGLSSFVGCGLFDPVSEPCTTITPKPSAQRTGAASCSFACAAGLSTGSASNRRRFTSLCR